MALKKKVNKATVIRQKAKVVRKWASKMRHRGKLSGKDVQKLDKYEKFGIDQTKNTVLTDDLDFARFQQKVLADQLDEQFGHQVFSSDDSSDDEEIAKKMKKPTHIKEENSDDDENNMDAELEQKYSKSKRSDYFQKADSLVELKEFLPLKTASGKIIQVAKEVLIKKEEPDQQDDQENLISEENEEESPEIKSSEPISTAQLFASRAELIEKYKKQIAANCSLLISDPEKNVSKLKILLRLAKGEGVEQLVQTSITKLATASLSEVFMDIIPSYHIRPWSDAEETQKMKKETKELHIFEESLLKSYGKFLAHLKAMCFAKNKKLDRKVAYSYKNLAAKSYCCLLSTHFHFNLTKEIIESVVPLMNDKNAEIQKQACASVESVFKNDLAANSSLDITKSACRFAKKNPAKTRPEMLNSFLCLKIKEVEKPEHKQKAKHDILARKRKIFMMSRREKKMYKRLRKLDDDLEELEAEEDKNKILKNHTEIMNQIFALYFRLLKSQNPQSIDWKLLGPVFEGLAKFAHLINVEFFDDLIRSLLELIQNEHIRIIDSLHCVKTAFTILSGEGQSLNIDPYGFYRYVYRIIDKIGVEKNKEYKKKQLSLCLQCMEFMLCARKKQVNLSRAAAFVKKLAENLTNFQENEITAVLISIRNIFVAHPKLECLIDKENIDIGGPTLAILDDPDRCKPQMTSIVCELEKCAKNRKARNSQLCLHILNGLPERGPYTVRTELITKMPWLYLEEKEVS